MKNGSLEEMIREFSDGTYDLTCNGECTQCGNCCSNALPMTKNEIDAIHRYIAKKHIKEQKLAYPFSQESIDMTCPYLDNSKPKEKCAIYAVRPRICRDFICCPSKRPPIDDLSYKLKCKTVDVRKEFFG